MAVSYIVPGAKRGPKPKGLPKTPKPKTPHVVTPEGTRTKRGAGRPKRGELPEGKVGYTADYLYSAIPGTVPTAIGPTGLCMYTEEQLDKVFAGLPELGTEEAGAINTYAWRENMTAKTEALLLRGLTNKVLIGTILKTNPEVTIKLVDAVQMRWSLYGVSRRPAAHKGEALRKIQTLEAEYWNVYNGKYTSGHVKILALNNLMQLIERTLLLHGLSPRVLEELGKAEEATTPGEVPMLEASVSIQSSLAHATKEALQLIAQAGNVIDGTDLIQDATYSKN